MGKEREHGMDVAKGLAILLVIYYHIPLYVSMGCGTVSEYLKWFIESARTFLPFFMPVFFVVSGYFMRKHKPFLTYLWGDVRHLLLIGLVWQGLNVLIQQVCVPGNGAWNWWYRALLSGGQTINIVFSQWFVAAIFWARLVDWCAHQLTDGRLIYKGIVLAIISCVGVLLEPCIPGVSRVYLAQGLVMAIYLYAGQLLWEYRLKWWHLLLIGVVYVAIIVASYFLPISTLEYGMVNSSYTIAHHPLAVLLALTGSALLIGLSEWIGSSKVLEFIGRNSLIFYIPQGGCLVASIYWLQRVLVPDTLPKLCLFMGIVALVSIAVLSIISAIYELVQRVVTNKKTREA